MKPTKQCTGKADPAELYEQLAEFNQNCRNAVAIVDALGRVRVLPKIEHQYYRALLEEARALVSQHIIEDLGEREILAAAQASRRRLSLEKQLLK